jgi:glutamine synthetase
MAKRFLENKQILEHYRKLKYDSNLSQAVYIWIDGTGVNIRSKCRILDRVPVKLSDVPEWGYCGLATGQCVVEGFVDTDILLVPRALYKNPFTARDNDVIVLCDTYLPDGSPCATNNRAAMQSIYDRTIDQEPWFGFEQEYFFLDEKGAPLGWSQEIIPEPMGGPIYCGVGADKVIGRDIVEAHTLACLYAGINLFGTNAEAMPGKFSWLLPLPQIHGFYIFLRK